jgi:hypothetical protein
VYVDLEADPKIDAQNPPDLKHFTEGVLAAGNGAESAVVAVDPVPIARVPGKKDLEAKKRKASSNSAAQCQQQDDVLLVTKRLVGKVSCDLIAWARKYEMMVGCWAFSGMRPLGPCEPEMRLSVL